jgi:hypothetical protein
MQRWGDPMRQQRLRGGVRRAGRTSSDPCRAASRSRPERPWQVRERGFLHHSAGRGVRTSSLPRISAAPRGVVLGGPASASRARFRNPEDTLTRSTSRERVLRSAHVPHELEIDPRTSRAARVARSSRGQSGRTRERDVARSKKKSVAGNLFPNRQKAIRKKPPHTCATTYERGGLFPSHGEHEDHSLVRGSPDKAVLLFARRLD